VSAGPSGEHVIKSGKLFELFLWGEDQKKVTLLRNLLEKIPEIVDADYLVRNV
jgi:hypothetical protein